MSNGSVPAFFHALNSSVFSSAYINASQAPSEMPFAVSEPRDV
jgi:hypothetical protein